VRQKFSSIDRSCGRNRRRSRSIVKRDFGPVARTIEAVSATDPIVGKDPAVADDGSIPAEIARLGLRPGALLRVIESCPVASKPSGLAGSLPDFPDLDWGAFERGSTLARSDLSAT
jgi:hypothetical protein